jgi:CheY-like chemotaxis protein
VLVAEDDQLNRSMLFNLLTSLGFEVILAENGQEEVAKAHSFHPDVIVTDLVMPIMTGVEAVQQIRTIPELQDIPIIATSASVFERYKQQMSLAGCDAFVEKPIDTQQLLEVFASHVNVEWVYEDIEPGTTTEAGTEKAAKQQVVPPPPNVIEALYDLAMRGDMDEIQEYATYLEQLDRQFLPFASTLRKFAKSFQDEQILLFVKQYMEKKA